MMEYRDFVIEKEMLPAFGWCFTWAHKVYDGPEGDYPCGFDKTLEWAKQNIDEWYDNG